MQICISQPNKVRYYIEIKKEKKIYIYIPCRFLIYFHCLQQQNLIIVIRHTKWDLCASWRKPGEPAKSKVPCFFHFPFKPLLLRSVVKRRPRKPFAEHDKLLVLRIKAVHSWVPSTGILLTIYKHNRKALLQSLVLSSQRQCQTLYSQVCPSMMAPMFKNKCSKQNHKTYSQYRMLEQ